MNKTQKIYKAYVTREKGVTAMDIANQFKVTRLAVHQAVEKIRKGSKSKMTTCMIDHKKHCLWESRFLEWFEAIEDFRGKKGLTEEFRLLVHTMKREGFNVSETARFIGKDAATIRHHLKK